MTPGRLEANRCNAQKSMGPRTVRWKVQSRLNSLRRGNYSRLYLDLLWALLNAPPGGIEAATHAYLTPELAAHPLFVECAADARHAEREAAARYRKYFARTGRMQ